VVVPISLRGKLGLKSCQYSRGCGIDGSGENGDEIRSSHSEGRIFKTETWKVIDGSDIATTAAAVHQTHASSDVDLFLEGPGRNLHKNKRVIITLLVQQGEV
jgi:hypothetical protein